MSYLLLSIPTALCLMGTIGLIVSHFFTKKTWLPVILGFLLGVSIISSQVMRWKSQGFISATDPFLNTCFWGIIIPSFVCAFFLIPWKVHACRMIATIIAAATIWVAIIGLLYMFIAPPFTLVRWLDIEYHV